ncbi:MAG: hypothetical protein DMG10_15495 [Acidobacteria bacterium]|nr:MAG: hypothetical protein DMG10_15495 [Acidobacteriota bacterium]
MPVARDSDRSFQPVSREAGGPCKHSAKQKAFGTVLAWAVFSFTTAPKNPKAKWGLFGALGKRGGEEVGKGECLQPPSLRGMLYKARVQQHD